MRPGIESVKIPVAASGDDFFANVPESVTLNAGESQAAVMVRVTRYGDGAITLQPPPAFDGARGAASFVRVVSAPVSIVSSCTDSVIQRNMKLTCAIAASFGNAIRVRVTDPGLISISGDSTQPGPAEITGAIRSFTITAGGKPGTADVIISAGGYIDSRFGVAVR